MLALTLHSWSSIIDYARTRTWGPQSSTNNRYLETAFAKKHCLLTRIKAWQHGVPVSITFVYFALGQRLR
jgi:hypothetical protein